MNKDRHNIGKHEEFFPIRGYEGYFISKSAQILYTGDSFPKILAQTPNSLGKDNYFVVTLNNKKNNFVHRLMAKTFLSGEKEHVNHKDGNKQNNLLENLEWATPKENAQHAVDTGLMTHDNHRKKVYQYTLKGEFVREFNSDVEANEITGIAKQNISKTTLGKRPHAGGYQWRRVKLDVIKPVKAKVLKEILIHSKELGEVSVSTRIRNYLFKTAEIVGCKGYVIDRAFRKEKSDVIFVNGCRIEKIYFD